MLISIFLSASTEMIRFAKNETPFLSLLLTVSVSSPIYYWLVLTLSWCPSLFFSLSLSLRLTKLRSGLLTLFRIPRGRHYMRADILNRAPHGFVLLRKLPVGHPLDLWRPFFLHIQRGVNC